MPITEHNAPGFHYLVKWRRHDLTGSREFEERVVESHLSRLVVEDQPVYKPYDIYVLTINQAGEAVSPPKMVLGYTAESGENSNPHIIRSITSHPSGESFIVHYSL